MGKPFLWLREREGGRPLFLPLSYSGLEIACSLQSKFRILETWICACTSVFDLLPWSYTPAVRLERFHSRVLSPPCSLLITSCHFHPSVTGLQRRQMLFLNFTSPCWYDVQGRSNGCSRKDSQRGHNSRLTGHTGAVGFANTKHARFHKCGTGNILEWCFRSHAICRHSPMHRACKQNNGFPGFARDPP